MSSRCAPALHYKVSGIGRFRPPSPALDGPRSAILSPRFRRARHACLVNSWSKMTTALNDALQILRTHESELRLLGVSPAAGFGSGSLGRGRGGRGIEVLGEI